MFIQKALLCFCRIIRGLRRRLRTLFFSFTLQSMGKGCQICKGVLITDPLHTKIGDKVNVNDGVIIQSCKDAEVVIGNYVTISYGVKIITGGLILSKNGAIKQHMAKPIHIHDKVWIGANAVVLPGINIGVGAVVAAGCVVSRDVASYTVVAGIPAKMIRRLNSDEIDS
ncbi:MAG: hypothetical protein CSA20_00725 [Deltaproteobacteria bacterium]|nr:MAG: hypothetical protein CSA20_00725 [Deltaproteobacteria bacterium]